MSANKPTTPAEWLDPDDAPELTDDFFTSADEFVGDRLIRRGRPRAESTKLALTVRYDAAMVEAFKAMSSDTHIYETAAGQGVTMTTTTPTINIKALQKTWSAFDRVARLRPIRNEEEYDRSVLLMNRILDVVGDHEDHALSGLLDLVSELVQDYDASHYAIEASEPREVLRYLMETRGLKQGDLAEILPQSNLSAILAGKRKISATLAGKLAKYFNISPAVFVPV